MSTYVRKNKRWWYRYQLNGTIFLLISETPQQTFTCSKSTIETLEKSVKYVQTLTIKTPERPSYLHC